MEVFWAIWDIIYAIYQFTLNPAMGLLQLIIELFTGGATM